MGIFNLSSRQFNKAEEDLLMKGLSFVPNTIYDGFETRVYLQRFFRSIKLKQFFHDKPSTEVTLPEGLKYRSNWMPPGLPDPLIASFEKLVLKDIQNLEEHSHETSHPNLTYEQRQILSKLKNDSTIYISRADKGGGIVIQNYTDYKKEAQRQLSDTVYYTQLQNDPTPEIKCNIDDILMTARIEQSLTPKEIKFLTSDFPRIPRIHFIPKIHKSDITPPGRPIVVGTGSVLEPVSQYLDSQLKHLVPRAESYIKDSTHFLQFIQQYAEQIDSHEVLLVTADVVALYTNVPQMEAVRLVESSVTKLNCSTSKRNLLIKFAELVIFNNYFKFENEIYLQTKGVAMGATVAPTLACLYMTQYEETNVYTSSQFHLVSCWKRFIDDIFFVWSGGEEALKIFMQELNQKDANIAFTYTYHKHQISLKMNNKSPPLSTRKNLIETHCYNIKVSIPKPSGTVSQLDSSSVFEESALMNLILTKKHMICVTNSFREGILGKSLEKRGKELKIVTAPG
uniref:Uncharacterized protein LOC117351659 n=1 Tax=Geotrypetes seraphini TaxID=260995 RepID=A0A6P8P2I1_GEOSA|nr:uncharacterized protein LOC117351659 [Geotrypetes seraphini]XP_033783168.1 uncharacterized protein LOC117351659 [Geotrypetes seraphini]